MFSEFSLSGGPGVKMENRQINTTIREASDEEGRFFSIKFLEGWTEIMCGETLEGGCRLCMTRAEYCTTAYHTWIKRSGEEIQRDK